MTEPLPRLALFIPELTGGGAERVTVNLAKAFADRGLDVDILLVTAVGPYLDQVPSSVRVVELGSGSTSRSVPALMSYLRDRRPEAIISAAHHANIAILIAKRLANVRTRVLVTIHNTYSMTRRDASGLRARLMHPMIRWTYPWADAVVAVSDGVADDFASSVGMERTSIDTVYNPVVTPDMFAASRGDAVHPWVRDGGDPVLIGIGRLVPQKDFATLIRAVNLVRASRPVRLVILGDGPERSGLESLVEELDLVDVVDLPGFVDNPYATLARADAFVLSSRWEGLPTVLIEALALGVPLVSTRCESGPVEILENGRYGRLVPVGDAERLAETVIRTLVDPLNVDPVAACDRFTVQRAVEGYLSLVGLERHA